MPHAEHDTGLRVLHVIPSLSATQGGPSHAIVAMETALASLGVQVETASTNDDGTGRRLGKPTCVRLQEGAAHRWYFHKWTDRYKLAPALVPWLLGTVGRYQVVHVHALFSFSSTVAAWAARWRGVPYIVRPLGVLARYGMTQRRPWLKQLSFRMIEGPILRAAAAVHFTSQAELDEALALGVSLKGVVIPLAVEAAANGDSAQALGPLRPAPRGLKLLFLSRVDPKKNLDGLIRAVAMATQRGIELTLLVAGTGPEHLTAELRRLSDETGAAPHLHWLGHVQGQSKANLLAAADVFVLPSHSENFGIAVAEALAAGLPCIVGQGVALSTDVHRAGAGLVTQSDAVSICEAIVAMAGSAEQRQTMSAAASRLARAEFSSAAMAQRLVALYRGVARGPVAVSA